MARASDERSYWIASRKRAFFKTQSHGVLLSREDDGQPGPSKFLTGTRECHLAVRSCQPASRVSGLEESRGEAQPFLPLPSCLQTMLPSPLLPPILLSLSDWAETPRTRTFESRVFHLSRISQVIFNFPPGPLYYQLRSLFHPHPPHQFTAEIKNSQVE